MGISLNGMASVAEESVMERSQGCLYYHDNWQLHGVMNA